jgi:23S rRNA (adenine2503-C2)-methyltransferase
MPNEKTFAHGLLPDELGAIVAQCGSEPYRAKQIWQWMYSKLADDWSAMKNLPTALRAALEERLILASVRAVETSGPPGRTRKILGALQDGECVEEVLIPARDRRTVCLSTQVGCRFNCAFCASGKAGLVRNLDAGEIVGQVILAAREFGERPSNIVYMGIGEPLDNYYAVMKSLRIINHPDGLGIGARRITISTSGVVPGIQRLAGEGIQFELSVSLHAAEDDLRSRIMPVNRRYPLKDLLAACAEYTGKTNRIITFEYTLIRGLNDQPEHARALISRLRGLKCRVNLIPLSPVEEFEGETPEPEAGRRFMQLLNDAGINATYRDSRGTSLKAACGQLRRRHL